MRQVVGVNKHGIRKVFEQKTKIGGRRCLVPWKRDGGGMKEKRTFQSKAKAEQFISEHDTTMNAYKCKYHKGWHIGHKRKDDPTLPSELPRVDQA